MSILIKGIDMPTAQQGCMTIRIYYDGDCVRHPQGTVIEGAEAVKVPTPHGRLVDADALKPYMLNEHYKYRFVYDADEVLHAPTIVEAEEET